MLRVEEHKTSVTARYFYNNGHALSSSFLYLCRSDILLFSLLSSKDRLYNKFLVMIKVIFNSCNISQIDSCLVLIAV